SGIAASLPISSTCRSTSPAFALSSKRGGLARPAKDCASPARSARAQPASALRRHQFDLEYRVELKAPLPAPRVEEDPEVEEIRHQRRGNLTAVHQRSRARHERSGREDPM